MERGWINEALDRSSNIDPMKRSRGQVGGSICETRSKTEVDYL